MSTILRPLCFVAMPFGAKRDPTGRPDIDFDRIYTEAIEPAIRDAELEPLRADGERTGGIIHKAMFERLLLCEFAVADLTTANANVLYELGVRHATRPQTTLAIFAKHSPLPFDVNLMRSLPYELGMDNRFGTFEAAALRVALARRLLELRGVFHDQAAIDSPLFQLLEGYPSPNLAHLRTDLVRDRIRAFEELRARLAEARRLDARAGAQALSEIEQSLGSLDGAEAGVVVDLFLSYRAVSAHDAMITLYDRMPEVLRRTVLVREQLAFALNRRAGKDPARRADRDRAIEILKELIEQRGPSSETLGILGRIYKDLWDEAKRADDAPTARGYLKKAIDAYVRGFEADWRDAYPGVNAVTLLELEGSPRSLAERDRMVPVVRYAVEQRLRTVEPDYWDYATLLELAVLGGDEVGSADRLADALAAVRERWEPQTTARNLRLLHEARAARGTAQAWLAPIIDKLEARAAGGPP